MERGGRKERERHKQAYLSAVLTQQNNNGQRKSVTFKGLRRKKEETKTRLAR